MSSNGTFTMIDQLGGMTVSVKPRFSVIVLMVI